MLGLGLAFISAFVVLLALKAVTSYITMHKNSLSPVIAVGGQVTLCVLLMLSALYTVWNFSAFAGEIMLKSKSNLIAFVSFAALSVAFAFLHKKVLLKLGVILFPIVAGLIVMIFLSSLGYMSIKYLLPYKMPEINTAAHIFFPVFIGLVSSALPLVLLSEKTKIGGLKTAFLLGAGTVLVCAVNVIGVFGSELASTGTYPYLDAVSTASMGDAFSRMDGFLYTACFFTSLIKSGTSLFVLGHIIRKLTAKILSSK
ncbi:MAG: hypothetical protein UIG59_03660 [Acutalibacteraceae bacterium]|nr:hypothetical protein [Acutalibacteraceae bacterium]